MVEKQEGASENSDIIMRTPQTLLFKYTRIAAVVTAYWVISISLVFINHHLLSGQHAKLDAPLFITCFQCFVSWTCCVVLSQVSTVLPRTLSFPPPEFNTKVIRAVLPVSVAFVGMITFNNLCLKYVGVAFYTVSRSLTTVFNVLLTYFVLHKTTTFPALASCGVIIAGFMLGLDQEGAAGSLSVFGISCGVLSSFILAAYSILTKKVLPAVQDSVPLLTYYNNLNAVLLFIPLILIFGEVPVIYNYEHLTDPSWWSLMVVGGFFGFAIGYVTALQIQVTSPLTHNVSGTCKACCQTVVAVVWFQEVKSVLWWVSNGLVLMGSASYARVRQLEMLNEHVGEKAEKEEKMDKAWQSSRVV